MKIEKIYCPKCRAVIDGQIEDFDGGFPFAMYYGYCEACDNPIIESEWEPVNEKN